MSRDELVEMVKGALILMLQRALSTEELRVCSEALTALKEPLMPPVDGMEAVTHPTAGGRGEGTTPEPQPSDQPADYLAELSQWRWFGKKITLREMSLERMITEAEELLNRPTKGGEESALTDDRRRSTEGPTVAPPVSSQPGGAGERDRDWILALADGLNYRVPNIPIVPESQAVRSTLGTFIGALESQRADAVFLLRRVDFLHRTSLNEPRLDEEIAAFLRRIDGGETDE